MIFVQDNSVQSINAALNVIQKNQTPAQTSRGRRFSSSATNKFSISVSGNAISCYIPDFPELVANVTTVKLILPQLDTGSPTLNINGLGAKPIKAVRAGQLVDIIAHTGYWEGAGSTSQRVWDNNTTLELIYDGTNWVVVGNPILCSYLISNSGSTSLQRNSYLVYANGVIHQWGTFDHGSAARDVKETVQLRITYTTSEYLSNFTTVAPASQEYYVGSLGIKAQTVNSMILDFYGTGNTDMTRWLKWETLGI